MKTGAGKKIRELLQKALCMQEDVRDLFEGIHLHRQRKLRLLLLLWKKLVGLPFEFPKLKHALVNNIDDLQNGKLVRKIFQEEFGIETFSLRIRIGSSRNPKAEIFPRFFDLVRFCAGFGIDLSKMVLYDKDRMGFHIFLLKENQRKKKD